MASTIFATARTLASVTCAGLFLSVATTAALADARCAQLVALNKQYAGVRLTSEQKQIKVQLVAWYKANCTQGSARRALLKTPTDRQAFQE